ncbi:hypothetical protein ASPVEDRAFT_184879 [Aspergillus versicolor CBS 583.65]|uniref:C3H1-type domain-containing protein n=1 Tax=Aspergillus versicolor CBS 583.65 TaxID=1036611 RepID=A0A1L9P8D8_ASPVE|nr:uncharacterized protein ASPVEDRAFT_184879 [Aspergillus versicolor CBS 583.65]OJI97768.1 hypothetical protein ASPVEDRAFT_184879 [Aspergillus versicolor CBS 583.65]
MNPQGFSFPPPPPPPPLQQHQPQQQYPHNTAYTPYGQNHHGQRGGRGGGGGNFRGRGRGFGNRGGGGGGRGGSFMSTDANRSGGYPATASGYGSMNYLGYPTQHVPNQQTSISAPQYTQQPTQNFQNPVSGNSFVSASHYTHSSVHGTPYQRQPSYDASYATSSTQQPHVYNQTPMQATSSASPTIMVPPVHWGFQNTGQSGSFAGVQRPNQRGARQNNSYNHQSTSGKHVNKRDHISAFGKSQATAPRVPAPPPVPSFGNPLPSKPPAPADTTRKPKKKKRKHNQLGLTPKAEEHESSEEEDDADEESRLAAGGAAASAALQVTYRGRTSKLQSSADIAAWIEERKKRFPTQARIEERKKAIEDAKKEKKAKEEAQRQQKEARRLAMAHGKKDQDKHGQTEQPRDSIDPANAAAKSKLKAEKLRRKLLKEEKRIAQAEADAERIRKLEGSQEVSSQPNAVPKPNLSTAYDEGTISDSDSNTDDSDWTSSSGSDLSSSDSDGDNDDSAPEQATSRLEGPERVPPPARDEKKQLCRHFARSGRCPRGKGCKFVHEKSERATKAKPVESKGRKGLLQALLDRQKEDENWKFMETILWLGENGLLDEPAAQTDVSLLDSTANSASGV